MSSLGIILLVVLLIFAFGGLPRWKYHNYGYGPSGLIGVIVVIVLILAITGRL